MNISSTVDQALRILIQLGETPDQSPADLGRALDMNRTAVHRLLATLHGRGFVRRHNGAAIYSLGAAVLRLADSIEPDVQQVARPIIERLGDLTGETVVLFLPDLTGPEPSAVAVDQVQTGSHVLRVQFEIGHRIPLHQGAASQAILAFSDGDVIDSAMTSAPDPDALRHAIDLVRSRGYTFTHDQLLVGVAGVASPIIGNRGVLGSISIAVPASRAAQMNEWVQLLVDATSEVAALLK
ncbi:IclR family transcriptional regulator [Rhodococcus sp. ARC_M12]|uniref:IclR family transcriptional regulator n=1 Tax=Rhodococcus sp. ARC_M12 TaxID=2928854 RepID=UPI001FB2D0DD|nr:IclR family transcriptional regulator [Rhodococcus sp. ARC_M12]MCJ0977439.1 IclR family transcriptional regulator [Rhodococcus sp. ARC_M12]